MKIQLLDWQIDHINYSFVEDADRGQNDFDLSTGHSFSEEDNRLFYVAFKIDIRDENFDLSIESTFRFQLDSDITEDFKLSDFPKVNAPAIAFPFLRAFVSNLTLQSGVNPVILPSINFTKVSDTNE